MAQQIGLHPNTFIKYLKEAIDCGYIYEEGNSYKITQLQDILKDFYQETNLVFLSHDILLPKNCKYNEVNREIEHALIIDNTYEMQERALAKKRKIVEIVRKVTRTGKKLSFVSKQDFKVYKKLLKKHGGEKGVEKYVKKLDITPVNITSARHISGKLKISQTKANKLMNCIPNFKRQINILWIDGCNFFNLEEAKSKYPRATVYPMLSIDKIKVSFGSTLIPLSEEVSF